MIANRNTEPGFETMSTHLDGTFLCAIEQQDRVGLAREVSRLQEADGPVAEWAEAIGTRLQIRDLLIRLKGNVASMQQIEGPAVIMTARGFFQDMDKDLRKITGYDTETGIQEDASVVKARRLDRLAAEAVHRPDAALNILDHFAKQPADATIPAAYLATHMQEIRQDIVETVWPAAMSAREGHLRMAAQELAESTGIVNHRLDVALSGVMRWD